MSRKTQRELRRRLDALIDEMDPIFRASFEESIRAIVSEIRIAAIVERLERNDIEGAVRALHIEEAAFGPLEDAVRDAYNRGGATTIANMPRLRDPMGGQATVFWNVRDLDSERRLRELSSGLVTGISEDARQAARQTMERGMSQGRHPNSMALDLAGRVNRATGQREGGVIGLTSVQEQYRADVREILSDPDRIREYFVKDRETGKWKPRFKSTSRRFDKAVRKAIEEGRALPQDMIERASVEHVNKMKRLRGEIIAQTETVEAVEASQMEAYRQGLSKVGVAEDAVTREWQNSGLPHVRHSHVALDGQKVKGLKEPFESSLTGARLMHPGDRSLGAPAREVVGCRCHQEIRIDYSYGLT